MCSMDTSSYIFDEFRHHLQWTKKIQCHWYCSLKYIQENEYKFVYQHIMAYRQVAYGGMVKRYVNHMIDTPLTHPTPTHVQKKLCAEKPGKSSTCSDVSCCTCGFPWLRGQKTAAGIDRSGAGCRPLLRLVADWHMRTIDKCSPQVLDHM